MTTPSAVMIEHWHGEIERMRQSARMFRHNREIRVWCACVRRGYGRALRYWMAYTPTAAVPATENEVTI